jgi:hypothetical protein
MTVPAPVPSVDAARSIVTLGGGRLVVHCNHYNVFLQRTIEDGLGARAPALLTAAAMETARGVLGDIEARSPAGSPAASLERAAEMLSAHGFGRLDITALGERGGEASLQHSHYALGWVARWGQRATPCCFFVAGFLAGAVAVAGRFAPERVQGRETACAAAGAPRCTFVVEVW